MNRTFIAERAAVLAVLLVAMFGVNSQVLGQSARVVSKFGQAQVEGRDVIVHVTVAVPPGADANQVALDAIRNQGARPFQSDEFSTSGLVWDQFFDGVYSTDQVVQHYNPANDPTGGGLTALGKTHFTWTAVGTSTFAFELGVPTNRCPSLVKECKGRQTFDGLNDVAWVEIRGCCTLAVTWYGTSIDEADMAINTKFSWATDGTGDFDLETVILHENGHVGGLGHSEVQDAVMFASYQTVRQDLHQDDIDGITLLYPGATGDIDGTVRQAADGSPIVGATVSVYGTSIVATTDSDGAYDIAIAPGTYDLTASALGFISQTHEVLVDANSTTVMEDIFLEVDENPSDSGSLAISNVSSQKSGKGGNFKITWNTNNPADSEVMFACCGTFSNSELVTDHSMSFRGQKGVTYQYSVKSTDAAGNTVTADGFSHVN